MRRLQPELFNAKVSPYLMVVSTSTGNEDKLKSVSDDLDQFENLSSEQRVAIDNCLRLCIGFLTNSNRANDTPYTTVVHEDAWINNIMIKKGKIEY